jgi:hypothetical protein
MNEESEGDVFKRKKAVIAYEKRVERTLCPSGQKLLQQYHR